MRWLKTGLVILLLSVLFICLGAKGCLGGGGHHTGSSGDTGVGTWTAITTTNVPDARYYHTAVWNETNNEMIVWGGDDNVDPMNTGAKYYPITNTWVSITTTDAPVSRLYHTAIWTGNEMIVWGGEWGKVGFPPQTFGDGAKYYPITDTWVAITMTDAPITRKYHTAIWTGTPAEGGTGEMIIWGGRDDSSNRVNTGAKHYPITDTWVSITDTDAPVSREGHTAIWTGNEMIVWGGWSDTDTLGTGGRYYPITDTWVSITTTDAPVSRGLHTAIWTGTEMIIWGGEDKNGNQLNDGAKYYPITDTWVSITTSGAPSAREGHTTIWTGTEMIIWGGWDDAVDFKTGGKYNPSTDSWVATTITNAPLERCTHTAIWTGAEMIIWGGYYATALNTGGRYKP